MRHDDSYADLQEAYQSEVHRPWHALGYQWIDGRLCVSWRLVQPRSPNREYDGE